MPRDPSCSPSTSSSSSDSDDGRFLMDRSLPATDLLEIAMRKRRELSAQKERNLRVELFQTHMIQTLCKHLGGCARRRRRARKRSHAAKPNQIKPELSTGCLIQSESESPSKRLRVDEEDPFQLDQLFEMLYGPKVALG